MTQHIRTVLSDDLDGTESDDNQTIHFGLDNVNYEIDLTPANAGALRDLLAPYVTAGRSANGHRRRSTPPKATSRDVDPKAVRAWAASNGVPVPARGRIPATVVQQYRDAGY